VSLVATGSRRRRRQRVYAEQRLLCRRTAGRRSKVSATSIQPGLGNARVSCRRAADGARQAPGADHADACIRAWLITGHGRSRSRTADEYAMKILPHRQSGQAFAEMLLLGAALSAALLLPFIDGQSVATLLLSTLVDYLRSQSFLLSIL
jgi:hypothetical protein